MSALKGLLLIALLQSFIGVLAVTRSLGDHTMKEFVVGNPYTTETELTEEDSFIILACDGVCIIFQLNCSVPHIFNSSLIFAFSLSCGMSAMTTTLWIL